MTRNLTTIWALTIAAMTSLAHAQAPQGDAKAGEKKIAMCIGCHGIAGYQATFPEIYKVPKISGQNAGYIASALDAYRKGDRKHPSMRGVADSLSDQDIADVAAYYASHVVPGPAAKPAAAPSVQVAELMKRGACVSCHGEGFSKPIDAAYPKVAGQHADYLYAALKSYKVDKNAKVGRSNGVMAGVAKQFTNNELKALAQYISTIDGDLQTVPQSSFR
jgi:cytochrome c553